MTFPLPRLLAPAAIAVCLAFAADISTDYDHHADFGRYHTYPWIGVRAGNSLWQDRITQAVDSALSARGVDQGGIGRGCRGFRIRQDSGTRQPGNVL